MEVGKSAEKPTMTAAVAVVPSQRMMQAARAAERRDGFDFGFMGSGFGLEALRMPVFPVIGALSVTVPVSPG